MGMLGGGTTAAATYRKGAEDVHHHPGGGLADGERASAAMMSGMAGMAGGGKPLRIQRTEFASTDDGLQGVVDGKVMVASTGNATVEDKTAQLEAMDFKALGEF